MKVFFDTNVLVAACLEEHEHHERAWPLVNAVHRGDDLGFASAHSMLEAYSILTRLPRSPRLNPQQAARLIEENVLRKFTLVSLTPKEYGEMVLRLGKEGIVGGRSYDSLHLACAQKSQAERIYTFNARHFQSLAQGAIRTRIVVP